MESVPLGSFFLRSAGLSVCDFCCRASGRYTEWWPLSGSHRSDDDHEVGRDAGDAGQEVRGQPGQVTLRELAGREDLQYVGRLEWGRERELGPPASHHPPTTSPPSNSQLGGPEGPTHRARLSQVPNQLRSLEAFRRTPGIRKQTN